MTERDERNLNPHLEANESWCRLYKTSTLKGPSEEFNYILRCCNVEASNTFALFEVIEELQSPLDHIDHRDYKAFPRGKNRRLRVDWFNFTELKIEEYPEYYI